MENKPDSSYVTKYLLYNFWQKVNMLKNKNPVKYLSALNVLKATNHTMGYYKSMYVYMPIKNLQVDSFLVDITI